VLDPVLQPARFRGAALELLAALAAGGAVYLAACSLLGVREMALLRAMRRPVAAAPGAGGVDV
jgi:hypothetical protein